jgi:hypothetical protein
MTTKWTWLVCEIQKGRDMVAVLEAPRWAFPVFEFSHTQMDWPGTHTLLWIARWL